MTSRAGVRVLIAAFAMLPPSTALATPSFAPDARDWNAVPTFHSIGLYWAPSGGGTSIAANVRFRPAGTTVWRNGHPLWFDARNQEYRGSLVELQPRTSYEVELTLGTNAPVVIPRAGEPNEPTRNTTTWREDFPIARTVTIPDTLPNEEWQITGSGTADGYVLYTVSPTRTTIDQANNAPNSTNCVTVSAHHVIVRGLTLRNCQKEGIELMSGSSDVVIEDNDISGWGRGPRATQRVAGIVEGTDNDAAVYCDNIDPSAVKVNRVVVQRNRISNPRYGSVYWAIDHPDSANGTYFSHCGTNHVFRYNEIRSTPGHFFNDGIGGADNYTFEGFPFADSDIYGNKISEAYDDGIESEGADRNVRIWGNYISDTFVGIANAANSVGPLYVWRNVVDRVGGLSNPTVPPDQDSNRGEFVKGGGDGDGHNGGQAYYYHNTTLEALDSTGSGLGVNEGLGREGVQAPGSFAFFVSKNNVWHTWKSFREFIRVDPGAGPVEADWDLYNGVLGSLPSTQETHGTRFSGNDPGYADPTKLGDTGIYALKSGADPTFDFSKAAPIANFNDQYSRPDKGAHQSGTPPMQFGIPPRAALTAATTAGSATVTFTGAASAGSYPLASGGISLDFGDNTPPGTTTSATHTYAADGTYTATLTATATNGASSSARQTFNVSTGTGPIARLSPASPSGPAPLSVNFDASASTAGSSPIAGYAIDFGDGSSGTGVQQVHVYSVPNVYTATLTVTDGNGLRSSASQQVTATGPSSGTFELDFSANPGPIVARGETIDFIVAASDGRALQSVKFTIDGVLLATDTTAPYSFSWTSPANAALGDHRIVVDATDAAGVVSSKTRTLTLLAQGCAIGVSASSLSRGEPLGVAAACSAHATVQQVELYIDGVLYSADMTAPYGWTLDTGALNAGTRVLQIVGRFSGGTSSADSASITLNIAPLDLAFDPGPLVMRGDRMTVRAAPTDGRTFRQVDFYVDGVFQRGETVAPYELQWNTTTADRHGRHTLTVNATDTAGNVLTTTRDLYLTTRTCNIMLGTSKYLVAGNDTIYVDGNNIPQGQPVTVRGVCAVPVQRMEFYVDGVLKATVSQGPLYTWIMDTAAMGFAVGQKPVIRVRGVISATGESNHWTTIEIIDP